MRRESSLFPLIFSVLPSTAALAVTQGMTIGEDNWGNRWTRSDLKSQNASTEP
jgi:hypothetical protein